MRIFLTLLFALGILIHLNAQYSTPNTGVRWTLDSIVVHAPEAITVTADTFSMIQEIELSETDSLIIDDNIVLAIAEGIEFKVRGYFHCDADSILITAIDTTKPYKGFWFYDTAEVYFNHTSVEYGGGLRVITPNFVIENSNISNNQNERGSSTGGAISFSKGSPVVRNCVFKNNVHPALSSAANASVAIQITDSYFEANNLKNNNRPQINMGPSGDVDSTRIINCNVIGDRRLTVVGGISVSSLTGVPNQFLIKDNIIRDNRYGFTTFGSSVGAIINNIIEDNNTETNPLNGGSGISLYGSQYVYVSGNKIRRNLWGVTIINGAIANFGSDDPEDFNPGGNVFSDNKNNEKVYAIYNNTPNTIKALHNCWIEGKKATKEEVEDVIFHLPDDSTLGEILYDPFDCGIPSGVVDANLTDIKIVPNPAHTYFTLTAPENGSISIYTLNGNVVQSKEVTMGKSHIEIDLPAGVYVVSFKGHKIHRHRKLVVF